MSGEPEPVDASLPSSPPLEKDVVHIETDVLRPHPLSKRALVLTGACFAAVALSLAAYVTLRGTDAEAKREPAAVPASVVTAHLARIREDFVVPTAERKCETSATMARLPLVPFSALGANASPELGSDELGLNLAHPLEHLGQSDKIAVLRPVAVRLPERAVGPSVPGRYDAWLVVFDLATAQPLCQTHVIAWSSRIVDVPGVEERELRSDFSHRVHLALREGAERLSVHLDAPF
jgi:hypothetical protein